MTALFLIGRILFGGYFIYSGLNHLLNLKMMSGYAESKKIPIPTASVVISGLLIIFGGLGVLFWIYTKVALTLIAIFLVVVSFSMHNFWSVKDPATKMGETVNFNKNLALLGATLIMMLIR